MLSSPLKISLTPVKILPVIRGPLQVIVPFMMLSQSPPAF